MFLKIMLCLYSIIHNQDTTKQVSAIYWDKGQIVIEEYSLSI